MALGTIHDPLNVVEVDGVSENDLHSLPLITVASGDSLRFRHQDDLRDLGEVPVAATIVAATNPVLLGEADPFAAGVVSRADAAVSAIRLAAANLAWTVSLRRAGCGSDTLTAPPLVHLRRRGTSAFKAVYVDDLLYVGTSYSPGGQAACAGASVQNRVFALRASDGAILWQFNHDVDFQVDVIVGMALDRSRSTVTIFDRTESAIQQEDTLFVTTERTASVNQHSVWAVDVLTAQPRWSANLGRMTVAPLVSDIHHDRLYVINRAGVVTALRKSDGVVLWSIEANVPVPRAATLNRHGVEQRIAVVDAFGRVSVVRDHGSHGEASWTAELPIGPVPSDTSGVPLVRATSTPVIDASGGLYVGGSDGLVYQLDLVTGQILATRIVNQEGVAPVTQLAVVSPAMTLAPASLAAASSGGDLVKFCIPFCDGIGGCGAVPTVFDDSYATDEDVPLAIEAPGVLLNDMDNPTAATLVSGPAHGTVSLNADGSFQYVPAPDYAGPDSFTYTASNAAGVSNVATVWLAIAPVNDAPVAVDVSVLTDQGSPVISTLAATDVDGPFLSFALVTNPTQGVASLLDAVTGDFTYVPKRDATGVDVFTFVATDGMLTSNVATVTVTIAPSTLTVIAPNGGENLSGGASQVIEWSFTGQPGRRVALELLKGDALDRTIATGVAIGTSGHGSFAWKVPADADGTTFRVRVTATQSASVSDVSDGTFTIRAPTLSVTSPPAGAIWPGGTTQLIRWTFTGMPGPHVRIELLRGDVVERVIKSNAPIGTAGEGSFEWIVPARRLEGDDFRIRVSSTGRSAVTGSSGIFTISQSQ